jgi:hypothetical protein
MGARHQAPHVDPRQGGRDAAVVHREGHRHPALQERPVVERRGAREDREVGGHRRAARQPRGHAAAADIHRREQVGDRRARSHRAAARHHDEERRARLVGRDRDHAYRVDRRSVRGGGRDQGVQRRQAWREGARDGRRTLHLPPHDLEHARAEGRSRSRRGSGRERDIVAGPRSGAQRELLRSERRPATGRGIEHRVRLDSSALERPRHHGPPRDRVQVPSERLQADGQALAAESRQRRRHRHQADGGEPAASCLHGASGTREDHVVRAAPARAWCADVPRGDLGAQHPDADVRRIRPQLGAQLRVRGRCRAAAAEGQGSGNRSVANMFIDLGHAVTLTDEQFTEEMRARREKLKLTKNDVVIGCPLCMVDLQPPPPKPTSQQQR